MKIDDLIETLQRVRAKAGNVEVSITASCGTNSAFVLFDLAPPKRRKFDVRNHINGYGQFCLHAEISKQTRLDIAEGIEKMKKLGYRFLRSQYLQVGESPREGLSPCEWHNPW
jgi:hypothetical protein